MKRHASRIKLLKLIFCPIIVLFISSLVVVSCENPVEPEEPAGWFLQREQQDDITYSALYFVDEDEGWIGGSEGTIKHTSNGGRTWSDQTTDVSARIWDIQFMDDETGWACGVDNTILRTTNGGKTWRDVSPSDTSDRIFVGIAFLDVQTGWIASNHGQLLKSSDGGETWQFVTKPNEAGAGFRIYPFDQNTLYIWDGPLYRSFDDGATWDTTYITYPYHFGPGTREIFFLDRDYAWLGVGYAGGSYVPYSFVMITEDGGYTWTLSDTIQSNAAFTDCYFVNETIGWGIRVDGFYQSLDGGMHWTEVYPWEVSEEFPNGFEPSAAMFLNENLGWVLSYKGHIWKFNGLQD